MLGVASPVRYSLSASRVSVQMRSGPCISILGARARCVVGLWCGNTELGLSFECILSNEITTGTSCYFDRYAEELPLHGSLEPAKT